MSFRTNLQYLRAERHMTQEQLAMLLGVSRQSVTKWEAEKSYPEMDKLIKMCQIFECSLDDLVQGDVSRRAAVSQSAADGVQNDGNAVVRVEAPHGRNSLSDTGSAFVPAIPVGPNTDVCGYDEHMVAFARKVALGVALIILGVAAAVFTDEVLHSDGIVLMALFALVAAGLGFLIPSGMEHAAFVEAHPYVADFYTAEQKAAERRRASIILLGIAVSALFEVEANVQVYGDTLMMVLVAVGVGVIVHWGMLWGRMDVAEYNKEWLETVELSAEELSQLDPQSREAYLRACNPKYRRTAARKKRACVVIMLASTIIALIWLFVGAAMDASEGIGGLFWLPWVVGSLGSAIALIVIDDDDENDAAACGDRE
mgnify:CR=1 FL=1